jgi:hypothetical protein
MVQIWKASKLAFASREQCFPLSFALNQLQQAAAIAKAFLRSPIYSAPGTRAASANKVQSGPRDEQGRPARGRCARGP